MKQQINSKIVQLAQTLLSFLIGCFENHVTGLIEKNNEDLKLKYGKRIIEVFDKILKKQLEFNSFIDLKNEVFRNNQSTEEESFFNLKSVSLFQKKNIQSEKITSKISTPATRNSIAIGNSRILKTQSEKF